MKRAHRAPTRRRGAAALSAALVLSVLGAGWALSSPDRLLGLLVTVAYGPPPAHAPAPTGAPVRVRIDGARAVARVPPQFLSFAIDTSQVVGGHWWSSEAEVEWPKGAQRTPPFDFARPRLRALTRALAPAYLRIGGTEADSTYYAEDDEPTPPHYEVRLERDQWNAVVNFAKSTGTELVFTLNGGPGPRDAQGRWQADQATRLMRRAQATEAPVAVWELGNEVNAYWITHGLGNTVSPAQYAADVRALRVASSRHTPDARLAGVGLVVWPRLGEPPPRSLDALAREAGAELDIVSWHYYPQQSRRCPVATRRANAQSLLTVPVLDEVGTWADHVAAAVERHAPGATLWLGESGGAQCGGEPGVSDRFASSLWWLDQLGALARRGQQVVVRQTLAGSHYGMIDADTLEPRPDYHASVLFKRLMGAEVLDVSASTDNPRVRLYAHCTPRAVGAPPGSVTLLAVHLDATSPATIELSSGARGPAERYQVRPLHGAADARHVQLEGRTLTAARVLSEEGLAGRTTTTGERLELPPLSYTFWVLKEARASACL